ncbi:M23 family metallopeptidase [Rhodococcus sp. HNM0563]|uniref:M23 family metallopeptidase n=1 Tax=unclassified Rhodococcus (in: high G+C Gram-positive bacteria) TaxID=192944 RepID=UPI00146B52ED|nr:MULTISPECIES: M23 family metallopeptidase [unclassified Rhodococcus (in: high G+C Gram-positive bacteria)]MCK0089564.1 M23 family metallopeptidase [Rhodococcus sp. F64268]NLU62499.1 M23 family metallopeptidase [Rhodococcus sp. HNM0563]
MRPGSQITGSPARRSTTPDDAWDPWSSSDTQHFVDTDFRNTGKAQPTYYGSEPVENVNSPAPRTGAHRIPTPPTALKGRAAVFAVAAGAVVAAGQAATSTSGSSPETSEIALAADTSNANTLTATAVPQAAQFASDSASNGAAPSQAPQVLNIADPNDLSQFSNLLAKGQRFSEERAAREEAARRPLFALPAIGAFTSNFGARWGTLHAGVDIAGPIGTPILAVADGEVIDSGPASGFGMWIRLLHADGTVTVYGHINDSLVTVGQKVMAGDQIATMGNRGFSTGPHLHFEVHLNGVDKIDPIPWLATRGIALGQNVD